MAKNERNNELKEEKKMEWKMSKKKRLTLGNKGKKIEKKIKEENYSFWYSCSLSLSFSLNHTFYSLPPSKDGWLP